MQTILYLEVNVFAIIVSIFIFSNVYHKGELHVIDQKLFLLLVVSNIFILILDSIMWVIDGKSGELFRIINQIISFVYYSMNPVVCFLWALYAYYKIFKDRVSLNKIVILFCFPLVLHTVLAFLSMFFNIMFYIDLNNIYHRGQYFWIMPIISYSMLVYTLIVVIIKRKYIQKENFLSFYAYSIIPVIGSLIQSFWYGLSTTWIAVTLSILIVFINIQNDQLYLDHLTNVFNRRHLDLYLHQLIESNRKKENVIGIMMDIDNFKKINDIYGHHIGDEALINTSYILKKTFKKNDFIARYGGDEFVVILVLDNISSIGIILKELYSNFEAFNKNKSAVYNLEISIGYDVFKPDIHMNADDFITHIDKLMYDDKKTKYMVKLNNENSIG